jgi:ABC-type phosphate transport system auxiliary subunit
MLSNITELIYKFAPFLIQSATALAATFDVELVGEVAEKLLAPETKLKAANLLLAPTCNIQRVCFLSSFDVVIKSDFLMVVSAGWKGQFYYSL